jgi:starvation-inducible DNA-binding protein
LDLVYNGIVSSHREAIEKVGEIDPITEDMLIGQTAELEQFQWFLRAHLEDPSGKLEHKEAKTEKSAAAQTKK